MSSWGTSYTHCLLVELYLCLMRLLYGSIFFNGEMIKFQEVNENISLFFKKIFPEK